MLYEVITADHCFVLLEWKLDNSTDKLLTGIAIATGESSLADNSDGERHGVVVKYYTFTNHYNQFGDINDIVNIPLSYKEGNKFIPSSFDCVRDIAKKTSNSLNYYTSEKQNEYRKLLDQYGISAKEWENVIGRVNQDEGGMVKYFSDFKSGDALINKLLIKSIESKLESGEIKEDNSMRTLILNFAVITSYSIHYTKLYDDTVDLDELKWSRGGYDKAELS